MRKETNKKKNSGDIYQTGRKATPLMSVTTRLLHMIIKITAS